MKIALYCIYHYEAFENLYYEDIPEEAWEILKSFDLDDKSDVRELFIQLNTHYMKTESLEILEQVLGNGFYYDYVNWFKYLRID